MICRLLDPWWARAGSSGKKLVAIEETVMVWSLWSLTLSQFQPELRWKRRVFVPTCARRRILQVSRFCYCRTNSTRRFCALPCGVSLESIGLVAPIPATVSRDGSTLNCDARHLLHRLGAALREIQVVVRVAGRIRVPFDLQSQVGIRLEAPRDGLDHRGGLGLEASLSVSKRMPCVT